MNTIRKKDGKNFEVLEENCAKNIYSERWKARKDLGRMVGLVGAWEEGH